MRGKVVRLTAYELANAEFVGKRRQASAVEAGRKDAHGFSGEDGEKLHIFGAQCEVAAAKALGRYWPGSVDTFHDADIPPNIQVRGRPRADAELIVRDADKDEDDFVLVTGKAPTFRVVGWKTGVRAKDAAYRAAPVGRPAAYFVPQEYLLDIEAMVAE